MRNNASPFAGLMLIPLALFTMTASADIQDPPMNGQNAMTKLGRSLSNIFLGMTEIPATVAENDHRNGNGALGTGLVLGAGRTLARMGAGIYEFVTFPVPTYRGTYEPVLPSVAPWVQGGFEEYPPELGFESRFSYSRSRVSKSRLP